MTATGIIAEFNPFHHGHAYLLEKAQGVKIVAMSGNFVQRGEPAIVDKWTRAQMALQAGADLVVELPFLVAVQSADYFAKGAVEILAKLGIDRLTFGSEEAINYQALSTLYAQQGQEMEAYLDQLSPALSYPQKSQLMWEHFAGVQFSGETPNHILGLSYAKACAPYGIQLEPVLRKGAGYHSTEKVEIASATALRAHREDPDFLKRAMPDAALFLESPSVTWDNYWELLVYQILTCPDLTQIYQVNEEMAQRIQGAIRRVSTVEELVEEVATKRFTKARVRRLLAYILVRAQETPLPEGIHVLGFSPTGQVYLKERKKSLSLVSRIGATAWDPVTQLADQVYQLGHVDLPEQNWGRIPMRVGAANH